MFGYQKEDVHLSQTITQHMNDTRKYKSSAFLRENKKKLNTPA